MTEMSCPAVTNPATLTAEEYFNSSSSATLRDIGHPCQLTTKTQRWCRQTTERNTVRGRRQKQQTRQLSQTQSCLRRSQAIGAKNNARFLLCCFKCHCSPLSISCCYYQWIIFTLLCLFLEVGSSSLLLDQTCRMFDVSGPLICF